MLRRLLTCLVAQGNGWEAKLMQSNNSRRMFNAAAHDYSTEDM